MKIKTIYSRFYQSDYKVITIKIPTWNKIKFYLYLKWFQFTNRKVLKETKELCTEYYRNTSQQADFKELIK